MKFKAVTSPLMKFLAFTSSTCSLSKDSLELKVSVKRVEELSVSFLEAARQRSAFLGSLSMEPEGLLNIHALIKQFYRCYLPGDDKSTASGWARRADKCIGVCVYV